MHSEHPLKPLEVIKFTHNPHIRDLSECNRHQTINHILSIIQKIANFINYKHIILEIN